MTDTTDTRPFWTRVFWKTLDALGASIVRVLIWFPTLWAINWFTDGALYDGIQNLTAATVFIAAFFGALIGSSDR